MAGPHPHTHLHPHHKPKHLEYHHVTIDGTGTKSYGTPSQYEHAVLHQLRRIHHSRTGQAVFHEFERRSHHFMKIIPYEQAQINAFASAKDLLDAHGKPIIGKGGGSDSDVSYTPVMWRKYCNQHKHGHKSGAQPDEILFHEMVHATRQMRGIFNPMPLGFLYDTEEEFFAILLANITPRKRGA